MYYPGSLPRYPNCICDFYTGGKDLCAFKSFEERVCKCSEYEEVDDHRPGCDYKIFAGLNVPDTHNCCCRKHGVENCKCNVHNCCCREHGVENCKCESCDCTCDIDPTSCRHDYDKNHLCIKSGNCRCGSDHYDECPKKTSQHQ